jgi:putative protein-disulfide isomerase
MVSQEESMSLGTEPCVLYVMDAYCGWCHGFSPRLREFEAANRHRVEFRVISGGLFVAERLRPIGTYAYISDANAHIAQLTGAQFGEPYQRLLADGSFVMNSNDAAEALAALRAFAPERGIHFAARLQEAFYLKGRSLSDHDTIIDIAVSEGLDAAQVHRLLVGKYARKAAAADFSLARRLGVASYPTLLFVEGTQAHVMPATGATIGVLNARLDALLAEPRANARRALAGTALFSVDTETAWSDEGQR